MSSDAFENRIHEIDVLLKEKHDQLLKKVYHETFLLYQEGQIEEISTNIIPKLVEIGDSSFIARISSDFSKFDINKIASSVFLQCSVKHFLHFTKNVSDRINISNYKEKILSLNNAEALYQLASCVDVSYIPKITARLVELNNRKSYY